MLNKCGGPADGFLFGLAMLRIGKELTKRTTVACEIVLCIVTEFAFAVALRLTKERSTIKIAVADLLLDLATGRTVRITFAWRCETFVGRPRAAAAASTACRSGAVCRPPSPPTATAAAAAVAPHPRRLVGSVAAAAAAAADEIVTSLTARPRIVLRKIRTYERPSQGIFQPLVLQTRGIRFTRLST